jgi:hypothetical protein
MVDAFRCPDARDRPSKGRRRRVLGRGIAADYVARGRDGIRVVETFLGCAAITVLIERSPSEERLEPTQPAAPCANEDA